MFKDKELCPMKDILHFPEAEHFSVLSQKGRSFTEEKPS